jgi:hypothetical protein
LQFVPGLAQTLPERDYFLAPKGKIKGLSQ